MRIVHDLPASTAAFQRLRLDSFNAVGKGEVGGRGLPIFLFEHPIEHLTDQGQRKDSNGCASPGLPV
jgi:hypothetical protein